MNTMEVIGIILIIAGIILASVEMYIPGFGVPGISAAICLVAGVLLTAKNVMQGIIIVIGILCILLVIFVIMYFLIFKAKVKSPIVLDNAGEDDLRYLLGKEGVAVTDLRPAGKGNFEGVEFDVNSSGQFIQKGAKIVIFSIKDSRLTVKEV